MSTMISKSGAGKPSKLGLAPALVALAMVAGATSAQAAGDKDCNWYAQTSAKQMQQNQQKNCGLQGDGWSMDIGVHTSWCESVTPDEWLKAVQKRQEQLKTSCKS
jgi:hypothetical protein